MSARPVKSAFHWSVSPLGGIISQHLAFGKYLTFGKWR